MFSSMCKMTDNTAPLFLCNSQLGKFVTARTGDSNSACFPSFCNFYMTYFSLLRTEMEKQRFLQGLEKRVMMTLMN
jgi:hypothetical protein